MTDLDPRIRVCAVCGRIADHFEGRGWLHLNDEIEGVADHPVVPVRPGEVVAEGHCDFCHALHPTFELPARDFLTDAAVTMPDGAVAQTGSAGSWSLCHECAPMIERNDWGGLTRRVVRMWEARSGEAMPPEALTALRRMYRELRANVTGAVRPLTWPQPGEPADG